MKKTDTHWSKQKIVATIGIAILALILCVAGILCLLDKHWRVADVIASHVYFFEIDLSGLSKAEAEKAVSIAIENRREMPIRFYTEKNEWIYTAGELGLLNNSQDIIEEAYQVGRKGDIFSRYQERLISLIRPYELKTGFILDDKVLKAAMVVISEEEGATAKDAYFYMDEDGHIAIEPSVNGRAVNKVRTAEDIKAAISAMQDLSVSVTVDDDAEPELTTADLEAINVDTVLSSFSTRYNAGQGERSHNIWQACQYLDMTLIMPGQVFSFNDIVGHRTSDRGFQEAKIIENGQFTEGMGGGVCQVSSTLYGAILRANLSVLARQPHSLKIAYVEPGQDAMVAWGSSDLCFRNDFDKPILLHASAGNGTVSMTFYGDSSLKRNVKIKSSVVYYIPFSTETIMDSSLASGETQVKSRGTRGLECYVYKHVYDQNGVELDSATVSHDIYKPQKCIILKGP